ncbi:GlxA family transcriptional regulator [Nocardia asteroides]|uniref:GlxA family transcriptional regulator n=1 Tax=Nocardia asteroides TaxID=1824 RepID=UPI001E473989|nr:helix-turn-helix domain-containing protein [Nocardia asteroides]UGT59083.1 helix-turn-helix domain-containing protein [Nocardia asteroides]
MRQVVALALDGVVTFDLGCAVQAFRHGPDATGQSAGFEMRTCGLRPGPVWTPNGFDLSVEHGLAALETAEIVVVPGIALPTLTPPPEVLDALRAAAARGAVRLRPEALYVDEGTVLSSAGLDLCLHLVRRELGAQAAADLARWNVTPPHREGGQAQYISAAPTPRTEAGALSWAAANPAAVPDVPALAAHALMSERTFVRRFAALVGGTPRRWLEAQRTLRARQLLEATDLPVEVVAAQAGFGSVTALRGHLRAATGSTPAAYRRALRR